LGELADCCGLVLLKDAEGLGEVGGLVVSASGAAGEVADAAGSGKVGGSVGLAELGALVVGSVLGD
jgi:hypothetical protein